MRNSKDILPPQLARLSRHMHGDYVRARRDIARNRHLLNLGRNPLFLALTGRHEMDSPYAINRAHESYRAKRMLEVRTKWATELDALPRHQRESVLKRASRRWCIIDWFL